MPELKDFTPMPDVIVKEHGLMVAAVWGRMWRYAQMNGNTCHASMRTIANDLGLSKRAVVNFVNRLEQAGLVIDTTPNAIKTTHRYQVILPQSSAPHSLESSARHSLDDNLVHHVHQSSAPRAHKESIKKEDHSVAIATESPKRKPAAKSADKPEPDPRVRALVLGFQDLVGYKLTRWPAEMTAAKRLLADGHDAATVYDCYRYLKKDHFWSEKHLSLASVHNGIGAWIKAGKPATPSNGNGRTYATDRRSAWNQPDHSESEAEIRARINARVQPFERETKPPAS